MTKAGEKLIAAAKEAVKVSQCEHEMLDPFPADLGPREGFASNKCKKCGATFYLQLGDTSDPA